LKPECKAYSYTVLENKLISSVEMKQKVVYLQNLVYRMF